MAHLLLFLSLSSAACAQLPLYPGATWNAAMTRSAQERNPRSVVYVTNDDFDAVRAFYVNAGAGIGSDCMSADGAKEVAFSTAGNAIAARIVRPRPPDAGTTITYFSPTNEDRA